MWVVVGIWRGRGGGRWLEREVGGLRYVVEVEWYSYGDLIDQSPFLVRRCGMFQISCSSLKPTSTTSRLLSF